MPYTPAEQISRMALICGIGIGLVANPAGPARADEGLGVSVTAPLRAGIDAACAPLDAKADRSKVLYASYTLGSNTNQHWVDNTQPTTPPKSSASDAAEGDDATGTFAHVYAVGTTIAAAFLFSTETQSRGEIRSHYCYLNRRLARIRTAFILRPSVFEWTRTKYYADDGSYMTQTDRYRDPLGRADSKVGTAPRDVPVYLRPTDLPFYSVFRIKHAR